jgi:site-specific recombinase XerD
MLLPEALSLLVRDARTVNRSPHTIAAYESDVSRIGELLGAHRGRRSEELDVAQITTSELKVAFADFAGTHAPASVVRARSTWRLLFLTLVQEGVLASSPMVTVAQGAKSPSRKPRPLVGWERGAGAELLAGTATVTAGQRSAWPARDRALLGVLLGNGLRRSEIAGLNLGSLITHRDGTVELTVFGKGAKWRGMSLVPSVNAKVQEYLSERRERFPLWAQRPGDPLFVAGTGRRGAHDVTGGPRMSARQVAYVVQRVAAQSGMSSALPPGALTHALRHTFGSTMARRGEPLHHIAALMGHSSISTTQGYLATTDSDLTAALERQAHDLGLDTPPTS